MKPSLASRVVAVVLLSVLFAWFSHLSDRALLAKASHMTDAEIAEYYRTYHNHSVAFAGFMMFVMGLIYMMCVEFVSHGVRAFWRRMDPVTMAAAGESS